MKEDRRKYNGGNKNAGRKPKAEEQKLIEKLTPLQKDAYKALRIALKDKQGWAVKLFFEYMYGKPNQKMDVTTDGEKINIPIIKFFDTK